MAPWQEDGESGRSGRIFARGRKDGKLPVAGEALEKESRIKAMRRHKQDLVVWRDTRL
jgi:hypothetical protein